MHDLLYAVRDIVLQSGEIVRKNWKEPQITATKAYNNFATETDLAVENFLRANLEKILPKTIFLGEETCTKDLIAGLAKKENSYWIVDAIDGTTNLLHKFPYVATSVALWQHGQVFLAVISLPILRNCFWALRGYGAFLDGVRIEVSQTKQLTDSLCGMGFPYDTKKTLPEIIRQTQALLPQIHGLRNSGSAVLELASVACGQLDAFFEVNLKPWDIAAGWLIIEEAGGKVSNYKNQNYNFGEPLLASNGQIHKQISKILLRQKNKKSSFTKYSYCRKKSKNFLSKKFLDLRLG